MGAQKFSARNSCHASNFSEKFFTMPGQTSWKLKKIVAVVQIFGVPFSLAYRRHLSSNFPTPLLCCLLDPGGLELPKSGLLVRRLVL
jgi:hypothetical protein